MNYESLRKYKVGIYIKFCHMLRGKIFEINEEIKVGGQICPLPVCLGLSFFFQLKIYQSGELVPTSTKYFKPSPYKYIL